MRNKNATEQYMMVEAGGIEPPSEKVPVSATTCLFRNFLYGFSCGLEETIISPEKSQPLCSEARNRDYPANRCECNIAGVYCIHTRQLCGESVFRVGGYWVPPDLRDSGARHAATTFPFPSNPIAPIFIIKLYH